MSTYQARSHGCKWVQVRNLHEHMVNYKWQKWNETVNESNLADCMPSLYEPNIRHTKFAKPTCYKKMLVNL